MKQVNNKQVILKPVVSEKSLTMYANLKICTFEVSRDSSKKQIAYDFEQMFDLKPTDVKVVVNRNASTKHKSRKTGRLEIHRKYGKKAYISIGENKLDIFENLN